VALIKRESWELEGAELEQSQESPAQASGVGFLCSTSTYLGISEVRVVGCHG